MMPHSSAKLHGSNQNGSNQNTMHRTLARRRGGTIYIMAMGTSLIVVCLAVAGLQSVRVQRRINDLNSQTANAKKLAQAGIEFAQQSISSDPNWRTKFTNRVSVTRATTGGSFVVTMTDPADGVIANQSTDPIVVTSSGLFGTATQNWTAYLEPEKKLYAACRSSLYATEDIEFDNCIVTSNQWAYCQPKFTAIRFPTINMNCLSAQSNPDSNALVQRFVQGGVWPMAKPEFVSSSSNYVGQYYIDNSVAITASELPTGGTQLVKNGGFEANTSNWTTIGCTLTRDTSQTQTGLASCLVSGRGFINTPVQNITEHMVKGHSYTVSFWVRPIENQNFQPVISCTSSVFPFTYVVSGGIVSADAGGWTLVSQSITPTWNGILSKAEFQIRGSKWSNYNFDEAGLLDEDRVAGNRYIENVILGPMSNPFGSRAVSANGLYSIRVLGEKLVMRNCRINGTLVVTESTKTELGNAISWEPVGRNFPSLISTGSIDDVTTDVSLIESDIGVNFNPPTTPYRGASDSDASDTYPSVITGAIVSNQDICLAGVSTLSGPVMSDKKIFVKSNNLNINFDSDMILNPPPGFFADPPPMRLIPSSVQSVP